MEKFNQGFRDDPNLNYNLLDDILSVAIQKHITVKLVKYSKHKHKKSNWITRGIIHSIKFRDSLYKRLKNTVDSDPIYETLKTNLKTYNRILKQMIRSAKRLHYETLFKKYRNDIKKTWDSIKEVVKSTNKNEKFPDHFLINDLPNNDPVTIANKFNTYFVEIGPTLAGKIPNFPNRSYTDYLNDPLTSNLIFQNVTEAEVSKIIDELKPKASAGIDQISNKLLKHIKNEIIKPLTLIINQTLNTGVFPDKLKIATVLPIYKKGENYLIENYRPISILSSVSKVFESIIHDQLFGYFTKQKLFYENQYGFRSLHSTEMAALELVDRITCAMDRRQTSLSVFLDLSKAFDTLDHQILLNKLEHYGVRDISLKLFQTYLSGRNQIVKFNNTVSEQLMIQTGVPQGSLLGPLLFIIYLNDLTQACTFFKPVIYADDTALFTALEATIAPNRDYALNNELRKISKWFQLNRLSLNENKTKAMLFSQAQKRVNEISINIGGIPIEFVDEFKYLGIILDKHLTWKPHLNQISKKIAKTNGVLSRLKHLLPLHVLKIIYCSLILPYLSYGIVVWGSVSERLFKLQKRSIRLITASKYNSHTDPLFKQLFLLKVTDIYLLQQYKFIYKLHNHKLPEYFLASMFLKNNEIHNYETRHANDFRIPVSRHVFVKNSIRFTIPNVYNHMPLCIKQKIKSHSIEGFIKYSKLFVTDRYKSDCTIHNCYVCRNDIS